MQKRNVAPALLSFSLIIGLMSAAVPAISADVDVNTAIQETLRRDPELVSLTEELAIRESVRQQAGLYPNPTLDLDGATGGITGSSGENRIALGVSQEIIIGGKRTKRLEAAQKGVEEVRFRIKNRERAVAAETRKLINSILLSERKLIAAGKGVELASKLEGVAKDRVEAGDIPEYELNLARAEKASAESVAEEASLDVTQKRAELSVVSGLARDVRLTAPDALNVPKNGLPEDAARTRADILAAEADVARTEAEVAASKAELIPNLTVGIGWEREASTIEIGKATYKDTDHLLGIKFSMPIPVFNRNQGAISEAVARRSAAQVRRTLLEERARREIAAATDRVAATGRAVETYEKRILPQLEENVKIVQEAYQLGEVGIQAVIQEHRKYVESYEKYLASLAAQGEAIAALEAATGTTDAGKGGNQ